MSGKEWNGFPKGQMSPKVCTTANHNRPFHLSREFPDNLLRVSKASFLSTIYFSL